MSITTPGPHESADKIIERMVTACKKADLTVEILEPSTKIKVNASDGNEHMAETVTLAPDGDEVLMWWWSWGKPICPADQIDRAVELLSNVVAIRIF
jgi:hypothetical protein